MSKERSLTPQEDVDRIVESANRLGIELDEADALQWLTAIAASEESGDVVMDVHSGVFGHRVTMLDFSDADLAHFRTVGKLVEFEDIPGKVETALALSGSAAVRIDGAVAGSNIAGWRFDTMTGALQADDSPEHARF